MKILFTNYLLTIFRIFRKSRLFSLINVLGLSIGMAAVVLIIFYVRFEFSYDSFHTKRDRIFRLQQDRYEQGRLSTQWAAGAEAVGKALYENFPEVEEYTCFRKYSTVIQHGNDSYREENIFVGDTSFFRIFSFKLLEGNLNTILNQSRDAVISESTAQKYFGNDSPIGKTLGYWPLTITGVFKDPPENSHLKFDFVIKWFSADSLSKDEVIESWFADGYFNYLLLNENVDYREFEKKIPAFIEEQIGGPLNEKDQQVIYHLQPLKDIHLHSHYMREARKNGNPRIVYGLMLVSIILIIIAWINYINLSTAQSVFRAHEVGIHKVVGASRMNLIIQFLHESLIVNFLAIFISILIVVLVHPLLSQLTGLPIDFSLKGNLFIWIVVFLFFIVGGCISGLYPAFILSAYKPISVLRNKIEKNSKKFSFRGGLVIFQFTVSIILIVATITVYMQISYMQNYNLGFNTNQILQVNGAINMRPREYRSALHSFREEISNDPRIERISISDGIPGSGSAEWKGLRRISDPESKERAFLLLNIDYEFVDLYGLEILEGRNFNPDFGMNDKAVLLNETAIRILGYSDLKSAINRKIILYNDTLQIIGIIKDYLQGGIKSTNPIIVYKFDELSRWNYSMKIQTADITNTIRTIERKYKNFFPGNPFSYFFLDDHIKKQYEEESRLGKVFTLFSILAVIIACLGLFGLVHFSTSRRKKEIGIRKVLGSTTGQILMLLSKQFVFHITWAVLSGIPIAYLLMSKWLIDFPYKISLGWWFFVLPVAAATIITLCTISYQVIKTSNTNPSDVLRVN